MGRVARDLGARPRAFCPLHVKVERSLDGTTFTQIATVGRGVATFVNTGLAPTTTYYYRVRAYNASGNSAYSNVASTKTKAK